MGETLQAHPTPTHQILSALQCKMKMETQSHTILLQLHQQPQLKSHNFALVSTLVDGEDGDGKDIEDDDYDDDSDDDSEG